LATAIKIVSNYITERAAFAKGAVIGLAVSNHQANLAACNRLPLLTTPPFLTDFKRTIDHSPRQGMEGGQYPEGGLFRTG
jgi:hypothetical protein